MCIVNVENNFVFYKNEQHLYCTVAPFIELGNLFLSRFPEKVFLLKQESMLVSITYLAISVRNFVVFDPFIQLKRGMGRTMARTKLL